MKKRLINHLMISVGCILLLTACGAASKDTAVSEEASPKEEVEALADTEEGTVPYEKYTVIFDKNTTPEDTTDDESFSYFTTGWNSEKKSSVVEIPYAEDAFISVSDVPVPTRKGFYFAGWQTQPVISEEDIVNGVSVYQVFFGEKLSTLGVEQVNNREEEEITARMLGQDVMYLKDFEGLTEDGTVRLYARWVEAKEVSTEEELRAMAEDLYGAYILTGDITLTKDWQPVGAYFSNYEYFNDSWWTYAFRGTLDGNGHTIYGLTVNGAEMETPDYSGDENAIWHNDGKTINGTAALFGAICYANIENLTIDGAVINVAGDYAYSGDYCYAAALACFDMASTLKNITIRNPVIQVEFTDENLEYAANMFIAVGGLEAGGWNSTVSNCTITGAEITADVKNRKSKGGEIYVGGLIGECYATMKNNAAEAIINVAEGDESVTDEDSELIVNVGGIGASNTSATGNQAASKISVNVDKQKGASNVSIGGFAGAQRYLTADSNQIQSNITTECNLDPELGQLNVGAVIGRFDIYYSLLILMYADGINCGCINNVTDVTCNGERLELPMPESGYPHINGEAVTYVAVEDYTDDEGVFYKANVDEILAAYGGYITKEGMTNKIMYISID